MKNPLKKEYLALYKERAGGGYEFTGTYYRYCGKNFKRSFVQLVSILSAAAAVCVASGCLNAGGMKNSFYVILPYIGEVSALFALFWSNFKLLSKGERVKEYIYATTYPRLPKIALVLAILSAISCACSVVFIILHGAEGGTAKCVLYNGFKLAELALALVYKRIIRKTAYAAE